MESEHGGALGGICLFEFVPGKGAKLLLCENGNGCGSGGRFLKCPLGFSEKAVFVFCSHFAILRSDDGAYRVYPSVGGRRRRGRQQREVVVGQLDVGPSLGCCRGTVSLRTEMT